MPARRKKARRPREVQGAPVQAEQAPPQEALPEAQNVNLPARLPVAQPGEPNIPRSAEDVVANVINRQLLDEIENPPEADPLDPEIISLQEVLKAIDEGRPVAELTPLIAHATSGQDQLDTLVYTHYRRYRAKKLLRWLENDAHADRFLNRAFRRGDLTPAEALVFKRLAQSEIKEQAMQILNELREGAPTVAPEEAATRIDYNLHQTSDRTVITKTFEKMTPQGREIVRKLIFRARTKLFTKK